MGRTKPSIHIALPEELSNKLATYVEHRSGVNKTKVIHSALKLLFNIEGVNPLRYIILGKIIKQYVDIPKMYTVNALYVNLYNNATTYPKYNARDYWKALYVSDTDYTNEEIFNKIKDQLTIELEELKKNANT